MIRKKWSRMERGVRRIRDELETKEKEAKGEIKEGELGEGGEGDKKEKREKVKRGGERKKWQKEKGN